MTSTSFTSKKRQYKILGIARALLTLAIPFLILHQSGASHLETAQSFCPFKMLTGFPCPGCGITKSIVFLYDGDLSRSLYYHIFGVPVVMFSLALLLLLPIELASGKEYFNSIFYSRKLGIGLGVL
ncbi:MAG: DUF2752 domain-containing protein, partial [Chryseobacterium sp.]